jgi:hypothetical protein
MHGIQRKIARCVTGLAIVLGGLALAHPLWAQGCPLCYNTAAATGARGVAALRNGILILMIPPVIIFGVVCFLTLRGRNRFNDDVELEGRGFSPAEEVRWESGALAPEATRFQGLEGVQFPAQRRRG